MSEIDETQLAFLEELANQWVDLDIEEKAIRETMETDESTLLLVQAIEDLEKDLAQAKAQLAEHCIGWEHGLGIVASNKETVQDQAKEAWRLMGGKRPKSFNLARCQVNIRTTKKAEVRNTGDAIKDLLKYEKLETVIKAWDHKELLKLHQALDLAGVQIIHYDHISIKPLNQGGD